MNAKTKQTSLDAADLLRISNRRRRIAWDVRDSVRMGFRTKSDLTGKVGHSAEEIQIALDLGEVFQAADGIYEVMPVWAVPDPDAPPVADFTPLASDSPILDKNTQQSFQASTVKYRGRSRKGMEIYTAHRLEELKPLQIAAHENGEIAIIKNLGYEGKAKLILIEQPPPDDSEPEELENNAD